MKTLNFLLMATVILVGASKDGQGQKVEHTEYLYIVAELPVEANDNLHIYVSKNGNHYEKKVTDSQELQGKYDLNPLIDLIREYNKGGWKMHEGGFQVPGCEEGNHKKLIILMTRLRPYRIKHTPIDTLFNKQQGCFEIPIEVI
jgi:hypothetical protein